MIAGSGGGLVKNRERREREREIITTPGIGTGSCIQI